MSGLYKITLWPMQWTSDAKFCKTFVWRWLALSMPLLANSLLGLYVPWMLIYTGFCYLLDIITLHKRCPCLYV